MILVAIVKNDFKKTKEQVYVHSIKFYIAIDRKFNEKIINRKSKVVIVNIL